MIDTIDPSKKNVRKFGFLFAVLSAVITAYMLYRGNAHFVWPLTFALVFLAAALFAYPVLKPIYVGWMAFASVLAWINTRVLLGLFFYFIITPIGLVMRLAGKDPLDERIDPDARSYWKKRERTEFDRSRYERLF